MNNTWSLAMKVPRIMPPTAFPNWSGAIKAGIYTPRQRVRKGSIIIMHMSGTARFTPQALDIVLTQNELLREDDPRKFKVGYLTDYLVPGYDQMK